MTKHPLRTALIFLPNLGIVSSYTAKSISDPAHIACQDIFVCPSFTYPLAGSGLA